MRVHLAGREPLLWNEQRIPPLKTCRKCCEAFKRYCYIGANLLFGLTLEGVGVTCLAIGSGANVKFGGIGFIGLGALYLGDAYRAIRNRD